MTYRGEQDLSYLNRDVRHMVIVDTNADSYANQPLNAVAIKPWQVKSSFPTALICTTSRRIPARVSTN